MDDPDSENESLEASVEELEEKVERLQNQTTGRNQMQMRAYDLHIEVSSEDASMEELSEICESQMESMMRRALIGEYQELESEDMFAHILGD